MKGYSEFKGYRTRTVYDKVSGQFVQQRIPHNGFEAKAEPAKPAPTKSVKTTPAPSTVQRLALLKRRIEAGRAAAKTSAQVPWTTHFGASAK